MTAFQAQYDAEMRQARIRAERDQRIVEGVRADATEIGRVWTD